MKTAWDYTELADAYLKRPGYAGSAIDAMLGIAGLRAGAVCDVGAGAAHLTLPLAERGLDVTAVEPNAAMRAHGIRRTQALPSVRWVEATGEATGQADQAFDLVVFGSSFNVCDRALALQEAARILRPDGWFACLWNHRRLDDPIQAAIEAIIRARVPGFAYGVRRDDQSGAIAAGANGAFGPVLRVQAQVVHEQTVEDCAAAWRSHATLARQAGEAFSGVVRSIEDYLRGLEQDAIRIPYSTDVWMARLTRAYR